ncbi:MAG: T9SS type A sorting domain-containing protein [Bacteroidia bacterium]|nr:T9SS type A sorting domain-containing protein [Bacteroidia bacterium]
MKLKTLLFCMLAAVTVCSAQVSLDINDCPSPGLELNVTEYWSGQVNLDDSVDVGMAGANGSYDISAISDSGFWSETHVIEFIDPIQTDWANEHPNTNVSTLADLETDSLGDTLIVQYLYYQVTDDGCFENGISFLIDTGFIMSQNPSGNLIEVHATYSPGGHQLNTSYALGFNSMDTSFWEITLGDMYHYEQVVREINVDGYGQLNTPDGVVDVLRVQVVSFETNHTEMNGNVVESVTDTIYSFEYWGNNVGTAIAIVEVNANWDVVYSVEYTKVSKAGNGYPTSVTEINSFSYSVYPNPADTRLKVILDPSKNKTIEIYNIIGDKVWSQQAGSRETVIDVSDFQNGVYFLNIYSKGEVINTEKVIINH